MNIDKEAHDKALSKAIEMSNLEIVVKQARDKAIELYNSGGEGHYSVEMFFERQDLLNMCSICKVDLSAITASGWFKEIIRQYVNRSCTCKSIDIDEETPESLCCILSLSINLPK